MNVSPKRINLTEQISTNSKKAQSLSKSSNQMDKLFTTQTLAEDVYHKSEHIPKSESTYESVMTISTKQSKVSASDAFINAYKTIYFSGVPDQLGQLKPEFDKLNQEIQLEQPELSKKQWGFSVDENDRLVVSGDLTTQERDYLETKLNDNEKITQLAKEIPTTMIEGLEHDRSFNGKSKYLGKYEVNRENFADIIDIKQLIASTEGNNSRFFDSQVDYFQYQRELGSQLAEKAEVKHGY